jgi:hypothetical protein
MKNKLVLGVIVLALFLGALFLMGAIPVEDNNVSMDITFYDADGNELGKATTTGFSMFGIRRAGVEGDIHSLKVAVSFTVTTDIENIGVVTKAYLGVVTRLNTITGGLVHEIAEEYMGQSNELEATIEVTYLMSHLLPADKIEATGKANGWKMKFNARLETVLTRPDWTQKTVEDTCGIMLDLSWSEQLALDSYIALP